MANLHKQESFIQRYRTIDESGLPHNLGALMTVWSSLRADQPFPDWGEWDWQGVPTYVIPWCTVVDVSADPLDFTYRFWGTARTRMQGYDATNKSVVELKPKVVANKVFQEYVEVVRRREPLLIETIGLGLYREKSYLTLRLPLGSGEEVEQILSVVSYDVSDLQQIHDYFRAHDVAGRDLSRAERPARPRPRGTSK